MKPRISVPLLIAALLLALGISAAACNGDGGLTLEEYFQKVEALSDKYDEGSDVVGAKLDQEFGSEEEEIGAIREAFGATLALLKEFVSGLEDIDPPAEAEAAHEESVNAGTEAVEAFQEVLDGLNEAGSRSEVIEVLDAPGFEASGDRFDQSCFDLQAVADANDIAVDLGCKD